MIAAEVFMLSLPDVETNVNRVIRGRMMRELQSILANVDEHVWSEVATASWPEALSRLAEAARYQTRSTGQFCPLRMPTETPRVNIMNDEEIAAMTASAADAAATPGPLPTDDKGQVLFARPDADDIKPNQK